ncbi:hypothetical protein Y042_5899 [Burkholderia pseudomallei MSHR1357]|nr:hypothetical protein Y042_5899 [Burkholderia pseudomallei MSHR1357]
MLKDRPRGPCSGFARAKKRFIAENRGALENDCVT